MLMIQELNEMLSDILAKRSLDWRTCFTRVVSQPPGGRTIVCECSDAAVLEDLQGRVGQAGWGIESRRIVYESLPGVAAGMPDGLIASSSVVDVRRSPAHTAELVTQVVYGDAVTPLKTDGDWFLVRLDDGYIGWIRSWHLYELSSSEQAAYKARAAHRVATNHAVVLHEPDHDSLPVTDLVIGTPLEAGTCGKRGWRSVRLPDGKEGFVASRSIERKPAGRRISRERLSATGMRFLGIPYIWGGSTPQGFDCSGLIQRIYRLNGLVIPRDTDMQARFGRPKPADPDAPATAARDLATGDLIFFGKAETQITHVAMMLSEGLFLHAYGQVRVGSLDPQSHLFDAALVRDWRVSRDILTKDNQ
jgi:cell wall-associated NlpC family hydrolase